MNRRVLVTVFCLLAIILGGFIRTKMPDTAAAIEQPFEYVDSAPRFGSISNIDVHSSRNINGVATSGIFLNVTFDFTPNERNAAPRATLIDAQKRTVSSFDMMICRDLQNGITSQCTAVFEVAPDAIEGAVMRVSNGMSERGSAVLVQNLQIDSQRANNLRTEAS